MPERSADRQANSQFSNFSENYKNIFSSLKPCYLLDNVLLYYYNMPMLEDIKQGTIIMLRAFIKGATGFIIIPLGMLVNEVQPEWEKASLPVKIFTGILLVPMTGVLFLASRWWQDFDIIN